MADEQNTQTTQTTEQTAALSGGGGTSPASDSTTSTPDTAGAEKTFTQSEVNALITARLERDRKGQPSKEELAEFHKWQDDQKYAEQKHTEALRAETDRANAAEKKAAALEAKLLAASKGVNPEAAGATCSLLRISTRLC